MDISGGKKSAKGLGLIVKTVTFMWHVDAVGRVCCDLGNRFV